jgi:hypothetical protein
MDEPNGAPAPPAQPVEQVLEQIQAPLEGEAFIEGQKRKSWLFVYDAMINPALFTRYVKGVTPGKVVSVPSYGLSFPFYYPPAGTALPTIERVGEGAPGVWGVIYDVTKKDMTLLERYLHVPNRYHKRQIMVVDRGSFRMPASTYVLSVSGGSPQAPSAAYRDEMVANAMERGLPDEWLGYLASLTTAEA